jgi:hypothetical protein
VVGELRCGTHVVEADGSSYEFGFNALTVEIQTINCSIKMGARTGDVDNQFVVKTKHKSARSKTTLRKSLSNIGGKLRSSPSLSGYLDVGAQFEGKKNNSLSEQNLEEIETIFHPVVSSGANDLIVQAPPGRVLRGRYLSQEDLCTIIPSGSGFYSVVMAISFQPMSVQLTQAARGTRQWFTKDLSKNKLAFANLLLAKFLNERNSGAPVSVLSRVAIAADAIDGPNPTSPQKQ